MPRQFTIDLLIEERMGCVGCAVALTDVIF